MSDTEKNIHDGVNSNDDDDNVELHSDSDSDLQETSVDFWLHQAGEKGSGFHTRNDPSAPFQRATAIERVGTIQARLKSREVIHCELSPDGENATLLVYDFRLDAVKLKRRVRHARLKFKFKSSVLGVRAPEVHAIAPQDRNTMQPSSQEETLTRGIGANAGPRYIVEADVTAHREKSISKTTSDAAKVTGFIFSDEYGNGVGVQWDLQENTTSKSGTPSSFCCAILLNRRFDEDNFECKITVEAKADWKTEMGRFFGSTPIDDPILFNPGLPPTNKLRKEGYDLRSLGSLNLDEFVRISFGESQGEEVAKP